MFFLGRQISNGHNTVSVQCEANTKRWSFCECAISNMTAKMTLEMCSLLAQFISFISGENVVTPPVVWWFENRWDENCVK